MSRRWAGSDPGDLLKGDFMGRGQSHLSPPCWQDGDMDRVARAGYSSHRELQTLGTRTGLEMHSGTTLHLTNVMVVHKCTHTDMERDI